MKIYSVPALMLAAICLTIAASDILAWARRERRREDLAFILVCLGGVGFCLCCAGEYSVDSSAQSVPWLRGETIASVVAGFALLWFIAEKTGAVNRTFLRACLAWTAAAAASQLVDLGELAWVSSRPFTLRVELPFGMDFVYREVERGPLLYAIDFAGLAMFAAMLLAVRAHWKAGRRGEAAVLFLGIFFIVLAQGLDFLIGTGRLQSVFLLEYAWLAAILVVGLRRSNDFIEAAAAKRQLKETGLVLEESQATLAAIMDSSSDLIWSVDLDGFGLAAFNTSFRDFVARRTGKEPARGMGARELFPREDDREAIEAAYRRAETEGSCDSELRVWGGETALSLSVNTIRREGKDFAVSVFARDVTEREEAAERIRRSLAEKEILVKELYHRTKNNMSVIISILRLQAKETGNEKLKAAFEASVNRILSMSMVHDKLYGAEDLSRIDLRDYVEELATSLAASCAPIGPPPRLEIDAEPSPVLIDTALTCGLILNELVTNAFAHAFPGGRSGTVSISLRREGDDSYRLAVSDDGVGLPEGFDPEKDGGLGFKLVNRLSLGRFKERPVFGGGPGFSFDLRFRDSDS